MNELTQTRLLATIVSCLDVTEDNVKTMSSDLSDKSKKAISNLKNFGIYYSEKKTNNRRQNKISKDEFKVFKNSTSSLKYKTLRSTCALESIVEKCSNNSLNFDWVKKPNTFPNAKKAKKMNNQFMDDDDDDVDLSEPSIVLFVIGGISQNEIVALERLQSRLGHKLYFGTTIDLTAQKFVEALSEIKSESDIMFSSDEDLKLNKIELVMK